MHRFFVPAEWINQSRVVIQDSRLLHQLRQVLRLRKGDTIQILDNRGWEYEVVLKELTKTCAMGMIEGKIQGLREVKNEIVLYQALLKGDGFDVVLEKGTEMGVAGFVPLWCQRCVPQDVSGKEEHRIARWQRIVQEAAEQCGGGRLPVIYPPLSFQDACSSVRGLSVLAWEKEETKGLKDILEKQSFPLSVNIFVGPEGGFTGEEVELARCQGVEVITLGRRLLRAETASIAIISAILYAGGDLGG